MIKVWNYRQLDFPREGLNHLEPSEDCQLTMELRYAAALQARRCQLDLPDAGRLPSFQSELRAQLWSKMGVSYDASLPLDVHDYGTVQGDGFSIRKITYQSRPGLYVTALLYIPDGDGPFPAVVNMHGHNLEGKLAGRIQTISQVLVKHGYVCISPDGFGVCERASRHMRKEYHGALFGAAMMNIGETLMGAQLVDNMRAVDVLCSLPEVRADRIGATGGSGGGNQTMWLSAMDTRIAAAMPVVSVGSFESYVTCLNCFCELLPDGLKLTEEAGVLALIAPRPLRIGNALLDVNSSFAVKEMLKTYSQVEQLYQRLGVSDHLAYTVALRPHGMLKEQREAMLGWFELYLKGHGHGGTVEEGPVHIYSEEELQVFGPGRERPPEVQSTAVWCLRRGRSILDEFRKPSPSEFAEKRMQLASLLRLAPEPPSIGVTRYASVDGWERSCFESRNHLVPMLLQRNGGRTYRIFLHPDGKDQVPEKDLVQSREKGENVVLIDLYGSGETANPLPLMGVYHQFVRQLLWLGRTLQGEWCRDILNAVRLLREADPQARVEITGYKEAGTIAVLAAALDGRLPVHAVGAAASFLFVHDRLDGAMMDEKYRPVTYFWVALGVPDILPWGDVPMALALNEAPVTWTDPRYYDGSEAPVPEK